MNVLYIDAAHAGVAGDMFLSALVSLGADPSQIEQGLKPLSPDLPIQLSFTKVSRCSVAGLHFSLKKPHPEFKHHHYAHLVQLFCSLNLNPETQKRALAMLKCLGEAEAKIHQIPLDQVHFHEVGAIDSLVDILGIALGLEQLNPSRIVCSQITVGHGSIDCSHGNYPVPAPATLEILKGCAITSGQHAFEMTTPTGAAAVKTLAQETGALLPLMKLERIGYGAGTRELEGHPNILRLILGQPL